MSGGSFNYLYSKEAEEWLSGNLDETAEDMRAELTELGYDDAAKAVGEILARGMEIRRAIDDDLGTRTWRLRDVFKAVEWYRSADWGLDRVKDAVEDWRAQ